MERCRGWTAGYFHCRNLEEVERSVATAEGVADEIGRPELLRPVDGAVRRADTFDAEGHPF
jgi:hypothetical protein